MVRKHIFQIDISAPNVDEPRGRMQMSVDGETFAYQEFVDMLDSDNLVDDPLFWELIKQFIENAC